MDFFELGSLWIRVGSPSRDQSPYKERGRDPGAQGEGQVRLEVEMG